jgi:menaquinone-dependent protoporphyrinogen oxidase
MDQGTPVLIGYATAAGSTRGVAERIAARLGQRGVRGVCRALGPDVDPAAYDAWVVGSAVHSMAWLPAATEFLTRAAALPVRPCWCFSVGGMPPSGPVRRWMVDKELRRVERGFPAGLVVRDHELFAGVVVNEGLGLAGRVFWRAIGGHAGDQRDWPAIDHWADDVADGLGALGRVPRGPGPGAVDRT